MFFLTFFTLRVWCCLLTLSQFHALMLPGKGGKEMKGSMCPFPSEHLPMLTTSENHKHLSAALPQSTWVLLSKLKSCEVSLFTFL